MGTTWNVRIYSQPDLNTCWRASLRVMLAWHTGQHITDIDWERRCRILLMPIFGSSRSGLADFQVDMVARRISLRSNVENSLQNFKTHLDKGPVMFNLHGMPFGHMVVAFSSRFSSPPAAKSYRAGNRYLPVKDEYFEVADPCATGYPPGPCRGGTRMVSASQVEASIKQGYIWYWN
ncbi:MAG: hypothetical protein ABW101_16205 [Candidatus Thiodiazotropha sp.]